MVQSALSPTRACPLTRDELALRALGATVIFHTDGEPHKRLKGTITFADVDTLHVLVEHAEGEALVSLRNCRVLSLCREPPDYALVRLNVWKYGKGWRGFQLCVPIQLAAYLE